MFCISRLPYSSEQNYIRIQACAFIPVSRNAVLSFVQNYEMARLLLNLHSYYYTLAYQCSLCFSPQKLAAECQSAGYSGTLIPYKCDLCNEEEILSMFSAIKTLLQGVDVCINNAGLAHSEPLLSGRTDGWKNMLDVRPPLTYCSL